MPIKIGFIGLDTSHVSAFAKLLNDPTQTHHFSQARVTVGYAGGSPDFPLSINRVPGFVDELTKQRGVKLLDTPEAVAEQSDLVFITACDGRAHRALFERVATFKKPVFIDKPLATSVDDARAILRIARDANVPMMSSSSLRYSEYLMKAIENGRDDVIGVDLFGPLNEEAALPGWFWYGCHTIEMLVAVLGVQRDARGEPVGAKEVRCVRSGDHDLLTVRWHDGRLASIRGLRNAHGKFGATIHRKEGPTPVDASAGRPYYAGLLAAILESLPKGKTAVPPEEMLHVVQLTEAANQSRDHNGTIVTL